MSPVYVAMDHAATNPSPNEHKVPREHVSFEATTSTQGNHQCPARPQVPNESQVPMRPQIPTSSRVTGEDEVNQVVGERGHFEIEIEIWCSEIWMPRSGGTGCAVAHWARWSRTEVFGVWGRGTSPLSHGDQPVAQWVR